LRFWLSHGNGAEKTAQRGPLPSEVLWFFGLPDVELALKTARFADYELPNVHRALPRHFRHWRVEL
jgi:hypothetical protein